MADKTPDETALLHLTTDGASLLGAWVNHGGTFLRFYSDNDEGAEEYAEEVLAGRDWPELLEALPQSAYMAWWEPFPRQRDESAQAVYERAKSELKLD